MYTYYNGSISTNKILRVKNENDLIIKEATFPKTASYIFFSFKGLNSNYQFYLCDNSGTESKITIVLIIKEETD